MSALYSSDRPIIEIGSVFKVFQTPAGAFTALNGVTTEFHQGEFVSVVGKSGSGKSTLINMITGIDHPTSGTVRVGDRLIHKLSEGQMAEWRGVNLGIVFQFFQLLPMLSLLENVVLPMDFCNRYAPNEREPRAMRLLELVGLADLADKMPSELSGGQQQSAAIARALANDPPILVADEPTGNLDSRTAEAVFDIFHDLTRAGKTIIMVTHDKSLSERTTRTILICDGELIDDRVARALPALPDRTLLALTKALKPLALQPGQTMILGPGCLSLAIVTSGMADAILLGHSGEELGCLPLQPGEVISLPLPENIQETTLALRALNAPAALLALDFAAFPTIFPENSPARLRLQSAGAAIIDRLWQSSRKARRP